MTNPNFAQQSVKHSRGVFLNTYGPAPAGSSVRAKLGFQKLDSVTAEPAYEGASELARAEQANGYALAQAILNLVYNKGLLKPGEKLVCSSVMSKADQSFVLPLTFELYYYDSSVKGAKDVSSGKDKVAAFEDLLTKFFKNAATTAAPQEDAADVGSEIPF